MSRELSRSYQVAINAVDAGREFEAAWRHANIVMQDVDDSRADYSLIWTIHFYRYMQAGNVAPDPRLDETIAGYQQELDEMGERAGLPVELEYAPDDEEELPKTRGFRARILKWIVSVERASGIVDEEQTE